jgi:hypothetical protein
MWQGHFFIILTSKAGLFCALAGIARDLVNFFRALIVVILQAASFQEVLLICLCGLARNI